MSWHRNAVVGCYTWCCTCVSSQLHASPLVSQQVEPAASLKIKGGGPEGPPSPRAPRQVLRGPTPPPDAAHSLQPTVLRMLLAVHGRRYAFIGLLKLLTIVLSFAGPVLLNALVLFMRRSAEGPRARQTAMGWPWEEGSVSQGLVCVAALVAATIAKVCGWW